VVFLPDSAFGLLVHHDGFPLCLHASPCSVVRVTATTVCGSDLHLYTNEFKLGMEKNFIIGHEGIGIVEKVRAPKGASRAILMWNRPLR
jgi:uncharacterized integral membrane protein